MTCSAETENIKELVGQFTNYVDGFLVSYNLTPEEVYSPKNMPAAQFLESNKKAGKVIFREYNTMHGYGMCEYLYCGIPRINDLLILRDSSERASVKLLEKLDLLHNWMIGNNIRAIYHESKPLFVLFDENIYFTPHHHFGLGGVSGQVIELKNIDLFSETYKEDAFSLRNKQRPADHRIDYEVKIFLNHHSNHLALYWNEKGVEVLNQHQQYRFAFLNYLDKLGVKHNVEALKNYLQNNKLEPEIAFLLNQERFLRNFYRYHVLKHSIEEINKNENEFLIYI